MVFLLTQLRVNRLSVLGKPCTRMTKPPFAPHR